jgi:hypothetical protein
LKNTTTGHLKFCLNIIFLLTIVGITDQLIGRILRHYYFKQQSGLYFRTTYAIDSTNADILVFGSSSANHHYVPEVFEDSLHLSFYNTGRDGNFLLFNYAVFKAVVSRYTPKIIIFDIIPNELYYEKSGYDRLFSLLPYYRNHPEIRSIIDLKSSFEKYKLISEIYPFNSSLVTIIMGNMELNKQRKGDRLGYVPLFGRLRNIEKEKIEYKDVLPDSNKINALKYIIQYCKTNKTQLIFIQSPAYALVKEIKSGGLVGQMAKENSVEFWDYLNDPEFLSKPDFFQDPGHLNDKGAHYFSGKLAHKIKELQTAAVTRSGNITN